MWGGIKREAEGPSSPQEHPDLGRTQSWAVQIRLKEPGLGLGTPLPPAQPPDPLVRLSLPTCPRDSETQENLFLDQEDWGPQRTSKEMRNLQNDCRR